tara:strand:+ start:1596 stop:1742 length:147 start_codon:yes stop_codon:yes gene_type:complete
MMRASGYAKWGDGEQSKSVGTMVLEDHCDGTTGLSLCATLSGTETART